ncbi:DNA/RNA non-specific endonuclease [Flavobacterium nackdongense]|uniref:DNA/RNA non-specific endonuclease n=1 Tax=Flavobacterium nackdongense TaxID=2547394 RepID=A0A4P6Y741_9FLAO|nr:DNA/RNA non-specific endonuclease [Flavobacterium nackdongense]QBN18306.1 DNA/RNA non-specific endonuclease [Flavobacterium nackdongense]
MSIVRHKHFFLSYSEEHEQAEWAAYYLTSDKNNRHHYQRPYFKQDPLVDTESAHWRNYKNTGFDKGHLVPAADMKFSQEAYNETFLTSNVAPQNRDFNSGIWNRLEEKVRYWADKYTAIFIVTGSVLHSQLTKIGDEDVSVPDYFYKIVVRVQNDALVMIPFLVPNEKSDAALYHFATTIEKIEEITGINFNEKLAEKIEEKIEKELNYKEWSFY